jgi:5-methylcytosine-specific restriction endonuclease McrA
MTTRKEIEKNQQEFMEAMAHAIVDPVKRARLNWSRTLVLNADYRPISVLPLSTINWYDAIKNVFNEKGKTLEIHEDLSVRSPSVDFHIPSVLVNNKYVRNRRKVEFMKKNVFLRDNHTCVYCRQRYNPCDLTYDHVVPRHAGGKTDWGNILTACSDCNHRKGNMSLREWMQVRVGPRKPPRTDGPSHLPYKPTFEQLEDRFRDEALMIPDPSWAKYLQWRGPLFVNDSRRPIYQVSGPESKPPLDEAVGF